MLEVMHHRCHVRCAISCDEHNLKLFVNNMYINVCDNVPYLLSYIKTIRNEEKTFRKVLTEVTTRHRQKSNERTL
jgi:hypothetical protein